MATSGVFFDKDGTLVVDVPYNVNPEKIQMVEDAEAALSLVHATGYRLFVVSNQSGVARGLFLEEDLVVVEERLRTLLESAGIPLAGFYYCPHHPHGSVPAYSIDCYCRKPAPGLIYRAAAEHGVGLNASWVVGDILDDVEAGRRAGCRTILIDNGNETEWHLSPVRMPHFVVRSLAEAALVIAGIGRVSPLGGNPARQTLAGERP